MRNGSRIVAGLFVVGVFVSLNCGGGSSGGGGAVTTVSSSKALNTLSASEKTQLCNDSGAYAGRAISKADICKFGVLFAVLLANPQTDAQARTICTSEYNQCLQAPASGSSSTVTCDEIPANCTATVGQYSACLSDGITAVSQTFAAIPSCSTLTLSDLDQGGSSGSDGGTTSAACAAFEAACPGFTVPTPGG
jgi:hypothetical protein